MNVELANVHTLAANAATIQQLTATNATIANLDITNLKFQGRTAGWTNERFVIGKRTAVLRYVSSVSNGVPTYSEITYMTDVIYRLSPTWFIAG